MKTLLALWVTLLTVGSLGAQDWAKARLEKSPRHLEWVKVKQGNREVNCFIAFPEKKDKATAVVVIHEIFGLTDWVRGVADQLAEAALAFHQTANASKHPIRNILLRIPADSPDLLAVIQKEGAV